MKDKVIEFAEKHPEMVKVANDIQRGTIRDQQLHISTLNSKVDRLEKENAALKANRSNVLPRLAELFMFADRIVIKSKVAFFSCGCDRGKARAVEFLRESLVTCADCGEIPRDRISSVAMVESSFTECLVTMDARDMATLIARYGVGEYNVEIEPLESRDELATRRGSGLESKRSAPNWTESR